MFKTIGFIVVLSTITACSSSDDSGAGAGSTTGFCEVVCVKNHDCNQTVDVQTCSNTCDADFASSDGKLRADFLSGVSSCYQSRDCATVLAGDALGGCGEETKASLAPSKQGTSFCEKYASTVKKCGGTFQMPVCLSAAKTASDPALQEAEACLGKVCADVVACVNATL